MALHKKTIGDIEVTAISDGYLNLTTDRILDWQPADVEKRLGLAKGAPMRIDVNAPAWSQCAMTYVQAILTEPSAPGV